MRRALILSLAALAGCGGSSERADRDAAVAAGGRAAALEAGGHGGPAEGGQGLSIEPGDQAAPPAAGGRVAPLLRGGQAAPPAAGGRVAPLLPGDQAAPPAAGGQAAPLLPGDQAAPPTAGGRVAPLLRGGQAAPLDPGAQGAPPEKALGRPRAPLVRGRWATARPTRRVALRDAPGGRAVGRIGRWTQFGGPRVVSVLRRRGAWLKVVVPERPNARPAWIPARYARLGATDVSLHVDRSARTLVVRGRGRVFQRVRIGVGAPAHPTPTGRFAVTDKLEMGGPGTTYGCCAIALSAHQPNVPGTWDGLDRIALHGTQSPETIGLAASLGCMHASEDDLRRLMRTVPLGAPVFIRA